MSKYLWFGMTSYPRSNLDIFPFIGNQVESAKKKKRDYLSLSCIFAQFLDSLLTVKLSLLTARRHQNGAK